MPTGTGSGRVTLTEAYEQVKEDERKAAVTSGVVVGRLANVLVAARLGAAIASEWRYCGGVSCVWNRGVRYDGGRDPTEAR